jgi:hypothetical protein
MYLQTPEQPAKRTGAFYDLSLSTVVTTMPGERKQRLDVLGFEWKIYK